MYVASAWPDTFLDSSNLRFGGILLSGNEVPEPILVAKPENSLDSFWVTAGGDILVVDLGVS